MNYLNIMVLVIGLSAGIYKATYAEKQTVSSNNTTSNDSSTLIELKEDNNDKINASTVARRRKVTPVNNEIFEKKEEMNVNIATTTSTTTTSTASSSTVKKVLTEGGVIVILPLTNANKTTEVDKEGREKMLTVAESSNNKKTDTVAIYKNDKQIVKQLNKNNSTTPTTHLTSLSTTALPASSTTASANLTSPSTTNSTSTTVSTPTTTTSTTTTTTTTPKPKKPTITFGVEDFPDLDNNISELKNLPQSSSSSKLPMPPDAPYAQPSQEFNSNFHHGRDYILPIVSMLFIIPLVIGILITSYRRFRDCWSTRHYRRMDFLVDGMYND